jgi:outer membrane protein assembly factor BamB
MSRILVALILCTTLAGAEPVSPESTWPGFGGHDMSGVVPAARLPERWSTTENVAWRAEIAGKGWSSPIVWNGVIYLTTAVGSGPFKAPSTGLYVLDALSGKEIYKARVGGGGNTFSASPICGRIAAVPPQ